MISEVVDDIDVETLRSLIVNGVREGKTIEYKRMIPSNAEGDVVPFLATVSSLANTAGGDVLIGMDAIDGMPVALPGVEIDNLDKEILRLEQVPRDGLEPRLPHVDIRAISISENSYVLLIRVRRNWVAPHRVKRNSRFYARNSAGRYDLDVGELRTAFTMSETVTERIRHFRTDRIARIHSRETPVTINPGGCMVLHVLPLDAFTAGATIDIAAYKAGASHLSPMGASGWNDRINLDGLVAFTGDHERSSRAYVQLFRSGTVESVTVLGVHDSGMSLASMRYEQDVMSFLKRYLKFTAELEIEPPYYVFLSLVGVRGCRFGIRNGTLWPDDVLPLREDMLIMPEMVIEDRNDQLHVALRPAFDMVWNAFGIILVQLRRSGQLGRAMNRARVLAYSLT